MLSQPWSFRYSFLLVWFLVKHIYLYQIRTSWIIKKIINLHHLLIPLHQRPTSLHVYSFLALYLMLWIKRQYILILHHLLQPSVNTDHIRHFDHFLFPYILNVFHLFTLFWNIIKQKFIDLGISIKDWIHEISYFLVIIISMCFHFIVHFYDCNTF